VDKRRFEDGTVLVGFELPAAVSASTVSVCGDFNGWAAGSHPLNRLRDGSFRAEIALPAGDRWRFRYLLDGQRWENDWSADDYVPNGLGDDNSIVDLTDTQSLPVIGAALLAGVTASGTANGRAANGAAASGPGTDAVPAPDAAGGEPRRPGLLSRWWRRVTRSAGAPDGEQAPSALDGELAPSH
jgi:hypothetical protein